MKSVSDYLIWPSTDILNSNKKRTSAAKTPSIVSGPVWQKINEEKQIEKRIKSENVIARKQKRLEIQEKQRIEKEKKKILRQQQSF